MSDAIKPALSEARAAWRRAYVDGYTAAYRDHFEDRISRGTMRRFLGSALVAWRAGKGSDAPPRLARILAEARAARTEAAIADTTGGRR